MDMNEAVAKAIQQRRAAVGMTIQELSEESEVPLSTLQRVLHADRDIKVQQIAGIAGALRWQPSALFAEAERLQGAEVDADGGLERMHPRPGQTLPISSALDTLKHTVLSVCSILETASELAVTDQGEAAADVLDAAEAALWAGLAEHVEGLNPAGLGTREKAPGEAWREVNTYDNGAPVRLNVVDGYLTREVFPRMDSRTSPTEVQP